MTYARSSYLGFVARVWRFSGKELRETLRDRRTILTLVLMPLLLYPLLTIAFRQFFLSTSLSHGSPTSHHANEFDYAIGTVKESDRLLLGVLLSRGQSLLDVTKKNTQSDKFTDEKRCYSGVFDDLTSALRERKIHLGFVAHKNPPDSGFEYTINLLTLEGFPQSKEAMAYVQERLVAAGESELLSRLARHELDPSAPCQVWLRQVSDPEYRDTGLLATLIPLILILMTITGAVYPAIDLTAGERERGTLEVLMAAPLPRFALLLSKYVAVLTVALLTALVNLSMMMLSLVFSGMGSYLFGPEGLTFSFLVSMLGLLLLFALFFSAVVLAVTSFARSFKEAQAYLVPLMLASMTPGMLALMPGLKLKDALCVTPLVNVVLLGRDLFEGRMTLGNSLTVVFSTLLYAAAALTVATRFFGAEAVLYTDHKGWRDWLRRPDQPQDVAPTTAVVLLLALLFAAGFMLNQWISQYQDWPDALRLFLMSIGNLVLYGGIPFVALYFSRLRGDTGLGLRKFSWIGIVAALLIGLSFWPFETAFALWFKSMLLIQTREGVMAPLLGVLKTPEGLPAVVAAVVLAPGLAEELFFRGYLFGTLRRHFGPSGAILGSALLFAGFHLFLGGTHLFLNENLAWEQLPSVLILGLCLGWIRERTDSVFPGMFMHLAHNAMVVVLLQTPETWAIHGQSVRLRWYIAGAVGLVAGFALMEWTTRKKAKAVSD